VSLTEKKSLQRESVTRKPEWLRVSRKHDPNQQAVEQLLKKLGLNTVCKEANCPNYSECFSQSTATFMILGTNCSRNCHFCNVRHDLPQDIDPDEPKNVAHAVKELGLQYVVVTSVTRDDLPDGGAAHFAATIRDIRQISSNTVVEVLIPDLQGDMDALELITDASPNVISHNMETVAALYPHVRTQADYQRSLKLIAAVKQRSPHIRVKSGIMLGLGETKEQVIELFDDLLQVGCELLTIGQYLAPSLEHHQVVEFLDPSTFDEYGKIARERGFAQVASAPLVRSSYRAGEYACA